MSIYNYYLYHGGIGSGRYPLGSGERPYQHRGGFFKKARKQQHPTRILNDNEKELLINSGNVIEVNKYKHQLSTQELGRAIDRINKIETIEDKARKKKHGKKAYVKAQNTLSNINNAYNEVNKFRKLQKGEVLGKKK